MVLLSYISLSSTSSLSPATQYWHSLLASVVREFCHSDIVFAVANEEEYPNDLRYIIRYYSMRTTTALQFIG